MHPSVMATSRSRLAFGILAVGLLAALPRPVAQGLATLHGPLTVLLGPIQQPARFVASKVRGTDSTGSEAGADASPALIEMQRQRDQYALESKQLRQQLDDLRLLMKDLAKGQDLNPDISVKQIPAPVIGYGPDLSGGLLTVRAGSRHGVSVQDVVVIRGVHLLGRVTRVDVATSAVRPITLPDRQRTKIAGVIMLTDDAAGPICQLEPDSAGQLSGKVEDTADPTGTRAPVSITPGMTVRLKDHDWPASAQMLIIGKVIKVEPAPDNLLRLVVTVQPEYDLARASEVMIRIPDAAPAAQAPGGRP